MKRRIALRRYAYFLMALAILCESALLAAQSVARQACDPSAALGDTPTDKQVREKVEGLLRQMTLEEKVAQLSQLPGIDVHEFKGM